MRVGDAPPPLTPAETRVVLQRLGDLTERIVLIGGQALAFWAERYADRGAPPGPINSQDIDFCGFKDAVAMAAARLHGTWAAPEPFSNSPNTGVVAFKDSDGYDRHVDFLEHPHGLNYGPVLEQALEIEITVQGAPITFKVMHPVHCLESRIANVGGLPGYQSPFALDQARASVLCAREYIRERLGMDDGVRAALNLNERIYRFAWGNHNAQKVFREYAIDPFDAILRDVRMPQKFRELRYPQMEANLARKRGKHAHHVTPA